MTVFAAMPLAGSTTEVDDRLFLGRICSFNQANSTGFWSAARARAATVPTAVCPPPPTTYQTIPSLGDGADTNASLAIGYTYPPSQLCFVATGLPVAPVLRVGVGHTLSIDLQNTLTDTGQPGGVANANCPIDSFGGEGGCEPKPVFPAAPGADGKYFPIMANQAHTADGTSNLHVHGLFVPPTPCSDEVLNSALYPTNWTGPISPLFKCQSASDELDYTYKLPADHPAGLYWYHTHRHGQSEHQTQMGLIGAIVVEDNGDAWRTKIGVTDEVLLIGDTPVTGCLIGPGCDVPRHHGTPRQPGQPAARQAAREVLAQMPNAAVALNPRIDQADQAGECAQGASGPAGGTELWTLTLNGAPVPEELNGLPPDRELLTKSMHPGERQIFRLANASANSWLAPQLVLSQDGVNTVQPLEVFARDGVGITDAHGNRIFQTLDVGKTQLVVPPAGRIEFVVHAPPAGAKLYLQSSQVLPGCGGNLYPARRLLLITPHGAAVDPGAADDSDLLENTPSLAPYLSTLGTAPSVTRTFVLAEYGRGFTYPLTHWLGQAPTEAQYDPSQTDFYITEVQATDGSVKPGAVALTPFPGIHSLAPQVVVHLHGQQSVTEDWVIENSTLEIHAFHMHQIHFRNVASNSPFPDQGSLLDTVTVPAAPLIGSVAAGYPGAPGWVKLRMTFTKADIGEFVFHCHILEHEDNGMMAKVQVVAD
jgi:FtsP/CotA-like multicopper oxidase with cupredoxin domain